MLATRHCALVRFTAAGLVCCLLLGCGDDSDDRRSASTTTSGTSEDLGATTIEPTPTTVQAGSEDVDLVDRFRDFARDPNAETASEVGFAPRVSIGLGSDIIATLTESELVERARWLVEQDGGFRGYSGPFDLLKDAASRTEVTVTVGDHPHCASPPAPPPAEVRALRRVSFQPVLDDDASCLEWWTIDVFVDDESGVQAVTLDLWEP